ncbi:efflux RND transporter periplasmic adaptor subunit [Halioxenophilus sp. WMMB6]|uniref:efflux RND transporter periplasmic adaptor subunit n=1 Tax=Halioxenophilus sp. WMMB6 TaxID=3073815 RepID=UPI00295E791A|nr:efflux RND transporter periplasmic adaptor subunit [Halioxenophilus sp. WMMB6]
MSKRMIVLLAVTVLVFGVVLGGKLVINQLMNEFFDDMPVPPAAVSTSAGTADHWISEVTSVGTVVPVQGADLTTQVGGIVERILFESGSEVKKGDLIITLDAATDVAELKTLQAAERLAELERDRVQELLQRKSISKSEYDQRQSELEQARARVAAQQARIAQKQLRAPYAGRLGIRRVNVGQFVSAGDPMINLQALDKVYVDFTLPEQRYVAVGVGMVVNAQMDALADAEFSGAITAIEPEIDANTRNFKVQATFENPGQLLRPGMFARIALNVGEERDVLVVPVSAISFKPYGNSVYVLTGTDEKSDEGKPLLAVKQRFVHTGEQRGDLIAIDSGLALGEVVATSGLLKLRSGGTAFINNSVQPDANVAPTPENR